MKVLESPPGVDIVKLACVCKGMKNMVNDVIDELLWRDKYYEEIERGAKWKQLEKQRQVAPSRFRCMQYRSAKRNQRSSA
ncbi:F-box protein SKIP22-like [Pyrus ussuriensis x Pyrus communis]|uniref:F-box protein SKIP22-like n=1 Tax=Pyrus ussuriensis x Pyrus communis TaxID=2448454 RepID=A0A5N5IFQ1_9ROSA|nr:F-box protein SKIP22-like [Pyrus ussuriensis x Pyrus communis]